MRILKSVAFVTALCVAGPALAWNENMTQPASNDMPVWAYSGGANYCPAGLQPVVVGGVVCCGTPNRTGAYSHQAPRRRVTSSHVSYDKGNTGGVIVYEKGQ